ncbi:MAG TPA: bacteriorhodopsin [Polyangiaceae bacterium LLY-WYZ-15_(1-7)]|nr:rhodopsin [Myxococcales bacterium]MAT26041.1 rhodopsin [Sandaracinus sp.]HJK94211.1 bacteriorhodopsin [Polyangiaceae bacterium LLY-WYZ-15_(1-7)]MBJ73818.1 rhodopsin [Sandaracinus sp.]HJL04961.1 bacteriorhodopsin [Polyangiaceae bacterium LLY-WYZ-15_(1-7)]
MTAEDLRYILSMSFPLVFIAFSAGALFLYLERDRVPEDFRLAMRVSVVYLAIAAVNYAYMTDIFRSGEDAAFPTEFRYIDWILTTPLMLLKFPLVIGVGRDGIRFMVKLVLLILTCIITGFIGETHPHHAATHYGFFLIGCVAWFAIITMLFNALTQLPEEIEQSTRHGVRRMSLFILIGWAIYPVGYLAPLLEVPADVRELVYNFGDLVNKIGLCLVVYATAKLTGLERLEEEEAYFEPHGEPMGMPQPAE